MKLEAIIYTDGSCAKNGDGGYAALVATPFYGLEISGWEEKTTNNRMELQAAIKGLKTLHDISEVKLVSDSAYMLNSIQHKWYERWLDDSNNRPNLDLWLDLQGLLCYHTVIPVKVKGHSGVVHNERVDKLAVRSRKDREGSFKIIYGSIN